MIKKHVLKAESLARRKTTGITMLPLLAVHLQTPRSPSTKRQERQGEVKTGLEVAPEWNHPYSTQMSSYVVTEAGGSSPTCTSIPLWNQ